MRWDWAFLPMELVKQFFLQVENSQLRSDLERLRQAVAGGGDEENNAVRELTGRRILWS